MAKLTIKNVGQAISFLESSLKDRKIKGVERKELRNCLNVINCLFTGEDEQ